MPMGPGYSTTMGGGGFGIDPIVGQLGGALIGALFAPSQRSTVNQTSMVPNKGVNPGFQKMMGEYTPQQDPFRDYLAEMMKNQNYWG